MDKLVGNWTMYKSENMEEFAKEYGLNLFLRKIAGTIKPTLIISRNGEKWSIKTRSTFKNDDEEFTPGIEFDKESQDGRQVRVKVNEEDGKLVGEQRDRKTGDLQVIGVKYVDDEDNLVEELICNKVKCKRFFKRNK